jgi:hypothetical protein
MELSPLEQLDDVLKFIHDNPYSLESEITTHYESNCVIPLSDVLSILTKLTEDKLISPIPQSIQNHSENRYALTIMGRVSHQTQGYTGVLERANTLKIQQKILELHHKKSETQMVLLTAILAFGTLALLLFEVMKYFGHIFLCLF